MVKELEERPHGSLGGGWSLGEIAPTRPLQRGAEEEPKDSRCNGYRIGSGSHQYNAESVTRDR